MGDSITISDVIELGLFVHFAKPVFRFMFTLLKFAVIVGLAPALIVAAFWSYNVADGADKFDIANMRSNHIAIFALSVVVAVLWIAMYGFLIIAKLSATVAFGVAYSVCMYALMAAVAVLLVLAKNVSRKIFPARTAQ